MDAVVSASREMIRKGSRSFALASRLFDAETREDAWMLYAWCRYCDDVVDGQELGFATAGGGLRDPVGALHELRAQTRRALAGQPMHEPVFQALQRVAAAHDFPDQHPLELLAGFEMDVRGHDYRTFDETLLYCYRVAGVVGVMMALVMGVRDAHPLQRAADLGIAFQLTNIARDVLDDQRNGRCYLPDEWLADAGVSAEELAEPGRRHALAAVVERMLSEADRYYRSACEGLRALPYRSSWAVATALGVYRDIGRLVRSRGTAAWDTRAVVSVPRKLQWLSLGSLRAVQAVTIDRWRSPAPRAHDLWVAPGMTP
jgi:phytoene synthase